MVSIQDLLLPTEEEPVASPRGLDERPGGKPASPTKVPVIASSTHFRVEFILDTICPHCYIGLKNLTAAIQIHQERHPEDTFEVTFSPIILNRAAKRSAYDKGTYYISHRGWTPSHLADWANMGAAAGIAFSWRGLTGHSRDSHKLLRFALEDRPTTARSTTFARGVGTTATARTGASTTGTEMEMGMRAAAPTAHRIPFSSVSTPFPFAPPPQTPELHQRPPSAGTSAGYHDPTRPDARPPVPPQLPQTRGPALQFRLVHAVFRAYFEEDRDLSDRESLAEIGTAVTGYPVAEVRACLNDDDEDDDGGGGDGYGDDGARSSVSGERRYSRDDPHRGGVGKGKGKDDQTGGIRERQRNQIGGSEGPSDSGRIPLRQAGSSGGELKGEDGGGGGGWGRAVDALEADVRARGIAAIPTIIVQDRYLAGGWQEAQLFVELFGSIRSAEGDLQQQQQRQQQQQQRSRSDIED